MITTTDIANIIVKDCRIFDLPVYQKGNIPEGKIDKERIHVISHNDQTPGKYWEKSYIEVNICVPDRNDKGCADLIRLNELERQAKIYFKSFHTDIFDSTRYRYSPGRIGIEEDGSLGCHYVNVKLLFETLNTL